MPLKEEVVSKPLIKTIHKLKIPLAKPDFLIVMKMIVGRPRDISDVEVLIKIRGYLTEVTSILEKERNFYTVSKRLRRKTSLILAVAKFAQKASMRDFSLIHQLLYW